MLNRPVRVQCQSTVVAQHFVNLNIAGHLRRELFLCIADRNVPGRFSTVPLVLPVDIESELRSIRTGHVNKPGTHGFKLSREGQGNGGLRYVAFDVTRKDQLITFEVPTTDKLYV